MLSTASQRLSALRELMARGGVDAYLVPTDDYHLSEYVGEYFKCRKYLTGFTGSAGTALVMKDFAGLWTDGRYFLQAGRELEGSGFALMKMGEEGVPTLEEYLKEHLKEGQVLGFDGRCVSAAMAQKLREAVPAAVLQTDLDLVGEIWEERPALSREPAWELEARWAGQSRAEKLSLVRKAMEKKRAQVHFLTSLDDIAWLLNLRGGDIHCCPVVLSFLAVTREEAFLFANPEVFSGELAKSLEEDGVCIRPYEDFWDYARGVEAATRVLLCRNRVSALLWDCLKGAKILDEENPTTMKKACKNETEQANMRKAHVYDGAAVTRFLHWVRQEVKAGHKVTELEAASRLLAFRQQCGQFLGNSFDPIIAYAGHAANPHYSPSPESDVAIEPKGLLLADTGGHYYEGTTDITRTIAVGPLTEEERTFFTAVLRGHLALSAARFKKGATGATLDILARQFLWNMGEDYNHGTGHGVGYLLNVHEGPQRIHFRLTKGQEPAPMEVGMVTSNEPGYYLAGEFGIRHENLVLCVPAQVGDGTFLCFENLTMVPFDLEALDLSQMTGEEIDQLNAYHAQVREALWPLFTEEERVWLTEETRAVSQ